MKKSNKNNEKVTAPAKVTKSVEEEQDDSLDNTIAATVEPTIAIEPFRKRRGGLRDPCP